MDHSVKLQSFIPAPDLEEPCDDGVETTHNSSLVLLLHMSKHKFATMSRWL